MIPIANRYWRGGNWNDTNNWAATNGGSPGASVPTSSDNVYPDTINQTSTTYTINADANCRDFDFTGAPNTPDLAGSSKLDVYGKLTLISAMTKSYSGNITFQATTTGKTITTAGFNMGTITFYGNGGEWTLQDDFTCGGLGHSRGTLITNNKNITCTGFASDSGLTRTLTLGSSIITCSGNVYFANSALTFNIGTSKIVMTGATKTFNSDGLTYYDLELQGTPITISGSNTFNDLKGTADKTIKITAGTTQTISTMSGAGTSGHLITLQSTSAGTPYTISKSSGTLEVNYYSIKDSTATGGATFNAINSTNVSGNTGWHFPTVFYISCSIQAEASLSATAILISILRVSISISAGASLSATSRLISILRSSIHIQADSSLSATSILRIMKAASINAEASLSATSRLINIFRVSSNMQLEATIVATSRLISILRTSIDIQAEASLIAIARNISIFRNGASIQAQAYITAIILKYIKTTVANNRTRFFELGTKLYIMDGTNFNSYDGTDIKSIDATPYVPTLVMGRGATGGGTAYEDWNLLGAGFKDSFSANGSATLYYLSITDDGNGGHINASLDATTVVVVYNGTTKTENTHFTVDRTAGTINFAAGSSPMGAPASGTDNVKITAYKTQSTFPTMIKKCTIAETFGGSNDTRLFVTGNPDYPNRIWMSGLLDNNANPNYFPAYKYKNIGNSNEAITGLVKQYDTLVIQKEHSKWIMTYDPTQEDNMFPSKPVNDTRGCYAVDSCQLIDNNAMCLDKNGVHVLTQIDARTERNIRDMSANINPDLLIETDLQDAVSIDYNKQYILCVNGNCYVADYSQKYIDSNGEMQYPWVIWDNINASCFVEIDGRLYFGSDSDGMIYAFKQEGDTNKYTDNGVAINSYWYTKILSFNADEFYKNIRKLFFSLKPGSFSGADIYIRTDKDNTFTLVETTYANLFDYSTIDYSRFTYASSIFPKETKVSINENKVIYCQFMFKNNVLGRSMGILSVGVNAELKSLVK